MGSRHLLLLGTRVLMAAGLSACAFATPPAAAPPKVQASSAGTCGLARFESDLLRQMNDFRASPRTCGARGRFAAAAPLRWSGALARLATAHANDMSARNEVVHEDAQGRGPAQRATQAGYAWSVFAENVAGHYAGTTEVMAGWQQSAGHCANLMNPAVTEFGVGCSPGAPGSRYKAYWAMELAKPR
jgi:uncharacterized protein YkwD